MGYTTTFEGELRFTEELRASQLAFLSTILGEDCRDHPEWNASGLTYIDFELTEDFSAIRWSGAEKSYDMTEKANLIIRLMRDKWPEFSLDGRMTAQGEDVSDRWVLCVEPGGLARSIVVPVESPSRCPHCGEGLSE